jgi:hypothetical protein
MNIPPSPQEQRPDEGVGHPAEVFWASEGAGAFSGCGKRRVQ